MFVVKSQNVCQYWCSTVLRHANVASVTVSIETSIPNNGAHPPVVGHGTGFAVEDSCGFKVLKNIKLYN